MSSNENKSGQDALIVVILLIVAGFGACSIFKGDSGSGASDNCYERVSQEILKREGNKVVNPSDVERYQREMSSRCR